MCHAYRDGGDDRKSTHERTVQGVQGSGTWKVQQEGNIMSVYTPTRTHTHTHSSSPRFTLPFMRVPFKGPMESSTRSINKGQGALHEFLDSFPLQCLTTRPGYLRRYPRLPPPYRLSTTPFTLETLSSPIPWIRFGLVSIDRRRPRLFLSFRPSLSIFSLDFPPSQPRRGSAAPSAATSPPHDPVTPSFARP